jgi:hypothetical protein
VSFFWYQLTGGKEKWTLAPSEQRQSVISSLHPVLVTVLDAKAVPQEDWTREKYLAMKYSGPLYMDWDGKAEELPSVINDFKETLTKLVDEYRVDPTAMCLYATGGKGFHLEIPMEVFAPANAIKTGVTLLPYVYRHMVLEWVTRSLDMKVYSARKGRHWRVPNIKRENGHYKVQISYAEAMTMTPELYDELTSEQRPLVPADTSRPSAELQALFLEKRALVEEESKRTAKVKDETKDLNRFNGEWPTSVKLMMAGLHLKDGAGFNNISLQLSILAHALGKSESEFLEACEGIIQDYASDGRYNSPRKRRDALRERFYYTHDNPCYIFSFGALKSIAEEGFDPEELRPGRELMMATPEMPSNISDEARAEIFNPDGSIKDAKKLLELADAALGSEVVQTLKMADRREHNGVIVNHRGIFVQTKDDVPTRLSATGFLMPWTLVSVESKKEVGLQATLVADRGGRLTNYGRHEILGDSFGSRAALDKYLSGYGSGFTGTDIQATCVRMALKDQALRDNNIAYVLTREGVDVITDPDKPENAERILVFVSPRGVVLGRDVSDNPKESLRPNERFMFRPHLGNGSIYDPDVIDLDPLDPSEGPAVSRMLTALMSFSKSEYTVASALGWFVSTFHRQIHHRIHGQFPILQIYGPAGSGKTSTPKMLARMFWAKAEPKVQSAVGNSLTAHARRVLLSSSASVPALIDEFKRSGMSEFDYSRWIGEFRTAYNSGAMMMGGIKDGSSTSDFRTITQMERSAPIVTMTETLLDETAFMERCVLIPMTPADQDPHTWAVLEEEKIRILVSRLGTLLLWNTLRWSMADYAKLYKDAKDEVRRMLEDRPDLKVNERPLTNMAIVICGLKFLRATLNAVGVTEFDKRIAQLCKTVLNEDAIKRTGAPKAEIYKALADVTWISHNELAESQYAIREGFEYCYDFDSTGALMVDVDIRSVFVKYQSWARARHQQTYYQNVEGFLNAMRQIPACVSKAAPFSPLRRGGTSVICRYRFEDLMAEDFGFFATKLLDEEGRLLNQQAANDSEILGVKQHGPA